MRISPLGPRLCKAIGPPFGSTNTTGNLLLGKNSNNSVAAESIHFSDSFESGAPGWSHAVETGDVTDRWSLDDRWTHSGDFAFLSGPGDDLVFDSSASGATVLESPPIVLPSNTAGTHYLRLQHLLDVDDFAECGGGNLFVASGGLVRVGSPPVTIVPEGGYPDVFLGSECADNPPYAGESGPSSASGHSGGE